MPAQDSGEYPRTREDLLAWIESDKVMLECERRAFRTHADWLLTEQPTGGVVDVLTDDVEAMLMASDHAQDRLALAFLGIIADEPELADRAMGEALALGPRDPIVLRFATERCNMNTTHRDRPVWCVDDLARRWRDAAPNEIEPWLWVARDADREGNADAAYQAIFGAAEATEIQSYFTPLGVTMNAMAAHEALPHPLLLNQWWIDFLGIGAAMAFPGVNDLCGFGPFEVGEACLAIAQTLAEHPQGSYVERVTAVGYVRRVGRTGRTIDPDIEALVEASFAEAQATLNEAQFNDPRRCGMLEDPIGTVRTLLEHGEIEGLTRLMRAQERRAVDRPPADRPPDRDVHEMIELRADEPRNKAGTLPLSEVKGAVQLEAEGAGILEKVGTPMLLLVLAIGGFALWRLSR
ncbi:MAG: hypothetical protein AAGE01_22130 [Pseudomonadota bacterium]